MTTEDFLIKAKEEIVKHFADPKNRLAALNFILKTFNDNYVSSFPKEEFICYSIICYLEQIDLVSSHALNNLSFTRFYNKLDSDAIEIKLHKIIPELKHPKDCGVYLGDLTFKEESNSWRTMLCRLYNTEDKIEARRLHVQKAIELLKQKK